MARRRRSQRRRQNTLIAYVRDRLTDEDHVEFARHVITRTSGEATEDHETLTEAAFIKADASRVFSMC